MNTMKPIGGLVALGVVAGVVGGAVVLGTNGLDETRSLATLGFVALAILVLVAAGVRSREWVSGAYW